MTYEKVVDRVLHVFDVHLYPFPKGYKMVGVGCVIARGMGRADLDNEVEPKKRLHKVGFLLLRIANLRRK